MMREEFEAITGAKVGYYFYAMVIEPLYMAAPECFSKFDYCKLFTKKTISEVQKIFYDKHPEMKEEENLNED